MQRMQRMHTLALTTSEVPSVWVQPFAWATDCRDLGAEFVFIGCSARNYTGLRTLFTLIETTRMVRLAKRPHPASYNRQAVGRE